MHFLLAVQVGASSSYYSLRVNNVLPGLAWVQERETVAHFIECALPSGLDGNPSPEPFTDLNVLAELFLKTSICKIN